MIQIKAYKYADNVITSIVNDEVDRVSSLDKKLLFVVPETSKATIERIIFDKINSMDTYETIVGDIKVTSGLINYDVNSFIKLAERIISSCGSELESKSDDLMLRNTIYRIFVLHGDEFRTINKYVKKFEYIDMIIRLLGDFTRYGVNSDSLDEVLNVDHGDDDMFYDKIYDLKLLIDYINQANEEFDLSLMDTYLNKAKNVLDKVIKNRDLLKKRLYSGVKELIDTDIVIYGFGSMRTFTPQENAFIDALSELGTNIYIYSLCDFEDANNPLYYFGDLLIKQFARRGSCNSVIQYVPEVRREENNLTAIAKAYSLNRDYKIEKSDDSVEFIRMNDCDDMLSFVCNEIIRLTRNEGYRYKDIRVFCPDETIAERFKGILRLFKLDAFIDRKIILNSTPVMRYVDILLELSSHNYPVEDVIRLLRTGVAPVTSEVVDYFENFCKAKNITFSNKLFNDSCYEAELVNDKKSYFNIYVNDRFIQDGGKFLYDRILVKILNPIKELLEKLEVASTISEKSTILMSHLDGLRIYIEGLRDEFIDRKDSDTASAIVRGYKEIMSLLSAFATPINDTEISLEQFASLIKIDIKNKVVGTIPLTVDSIEIVNESSACYTPCKVLFMVGCNSSNFPHKNVTEGIMSNSELLKLNDHISVELPDKARTQSKEEFIRSALIMNLVSDKAYMFVLDNEFENSVMTFFKNSCGIDKVPGKLFMTPVYGLPVERRHDHKTSAINPEYIKALFNSEATVSVSSLEKFNKCALQYMLDNILRIRVRDDGTGVKYNDFGTIVHSMFENAISDIVKENDSVAKLAEFKISLDEDKLSELANKYFNISRVESSSPDRNAPLYEIIPGIKIKRTFKRALPTLLDYCISEEYIPKYFEYRVDKLDKPFKVETLNGLKFVFNGSIDRVDTNSEGDLRIVDYKTGSKSVDLRQLIAGVQIQLFAYALALSKQEGSPVVNDVGYVEALMAPRSSDSKKKAPFTYEPSKLNKEDMSTAINHVEYLIKKSCEDISSGRADAKVNSRDHNGCTYCPFKGVCGNNQAALTKKVINMELPDDVFNKEIHKSGNSLTNKFFTDVMKRNEENG